MEHLLEENVALEDLKKFEARYQTELAGGQVSSSAQFDYAWCLVRSKYPSDIRKGILLLEDLYTVSLLRNYVFLVMSVFMSGSRVLKPGGRVLQLLHQYFDKFLLSVTVCHTNILELSKALNPNEGPAIM